LPDSLLSASDPAAAVSIHALTPEGFAGAPLDEPAKQWVAATGFRARPGTTLLIPDRTGGLAAVLFGLDASDPLGAGKLPGLLPAGTYRLGTGFPDLRLAALAFVFGAYRFTRYRADDSPGARLILPDAIDAREVAAIADGVMLARDLVNTAANDLGPAELAAAAHALAARHGAFLTVTEGEALQRNFPMIHAVGAAATAERAPRLIDIAWGDPAAPKITIVGKGVCFDTGGLDIKPSSGMLLMKKDMGGAANALGLAHMLMATGAPLRLRILIPAVENAIAGAAFRPGDVLRSRKGLTVEIGNTDAEGRLVLADALALAAEDEPGLIVDLATLTGAARVALGPEVVPFYSRDDGLAAEFARHGTAEADPVWRLPLWAPYERMLESKIADINNAGSSPHAGSITAALFLSRFVPQSIPWIHADIFAWNPSTRPGHPEGGEAQAIRALFALIDARYGKGR